MLFVSHALFAILFFLLTESWWTGISSFEAVGLLGIVLLGAALPDIDEAHSTINRFTGFFGKIIAFLSRHRGFFHSLIFFMALAILLGLFVGKLWAFGLLLGYVAHIVGDFLTPQGIPLFYPLERPRIRGFIKTGGVIEKFVQVGLFVGIVILLF
ncbi:metal-dependent hydrolase [Candidatus Woesearchaeota archaeon]|nr:metal-dependent hydrolase [Candidatus Woesearchaeota archaeon]